MSNLPLAGSEKRVHSTTRELSPDLANPRREAAVRVIVAALRGRTRLQPQRPPQFTDCRRRGGGVPLPPGGGNHPASPRPTRLSQASQGDPDRWAFPQPEAAETRRPHNQAGEGSRFVGLAGWGLFLEWRILFGRRGGGRLTATIWPWLEPGVT